MPNWTVPDSLKLWAEEQARERRMRSEAEQMAAGLPNWREPWQPPSKDYYSPVAFPGEVGPAQKPGYDPRFAQLRPLPTEYQAYIEQARPSSSASPPASQPQPTLPEYQAYIEPARPSPSASPLARQQPTLPRTEVDHTVRTDLPQRVPTVQLAQTAGPTNTVGAPAVVPDGPQLLAQWQPDNAEMRTYLRGMVEQYPYTGAGKDFVANYPNVIVQNPGADGGGGRYRLKGNNPPRVFLNTTQDEAAMHEFAHAWQYEQLDARSQAWHDDFVRAFEFVANDPATAAQYPVASQLLSGYYNGLPGWEQGMRTDKGWNETEIFAGLASGTMGDMRQIPPQLRPYYAGMFAMPTEQQPRNW